MLTLVVSFIIITIDFILVLSILVLDYFDYTIMIIDKFTKAVTIILDKVT